MSSLILWVQIPLLSSEKGVMAEWLKRLSWNQWSSLWRVRFPLTPLLKRGNKNKKKEKYNTSYLYNTRMLKNNYWYPLLKNRRFTGKFKPWSASGLQKNIIITPTTTTQAPNLSANISKNLKHNLNFALRLSGRLNGVSKARAMSLRVGTRALRNQSISSTLSYYYRPIYTKWGTIGLKLSVLV